LAAANICVFILSHGRQGTQWHFPQIYSSRSNDPILDDRKAFLTCLYIVCIDHQGQTIICSEPDLPHIHVATRKQLEMKTQLFPKWQRGILCSKAIIRSIPFTIIVNI